MILVVAHAGALAVSGVGGGWGVGATESLRSAASPRTARWRGCHDWWCRIYVAEGKARALREHAIIGLVVCVCVRERGMRKYSCPSTRPLSRLRVFNHQGWWFNNLKLKKLSQCSNSPPKPALLPAHRTPSQTPAWPSSRPRVGAIALRVPPVLPFDGRLSQASVWWRGCRRCSWWPPLLPPCRLDAPWAL